MKEVHGKMLQHGSLSRGGDNGGKIAISQLSVTATKSLTHVRCKSVYRFPQTRHTKYQHIDTLIKVKWSASKLQMVNKQRSVIFIGETDAIKCETDSSNSGSPGTISWYRNGTLITTGSITPMSRGARDGGTIYTSKLRFTTTKEDNQAKYECKINYQPTLEDGVTITVHWFATKIKMVEAPNSPIKEDASFNIKCETDSSNSKSPKVLSWYRNGQQIITGVPPSTRRTVHGGTIYISQLKVTAKVEDNQAKYECKIYNRLSLKKEVIITVNFKPKWNPDHPIGLTAACKPGDEAMFVLHVIANPQPRVTWLLPDNKTATGKSFTATTVNDTTFTLSKGAIGMEDYKNYTALVENGIGPTLFVFELQRAGPPQSPCCLRLVNATAVSLTLSFKSNFSGGTPQTFSVKQKTLIGTWKAVSEGIKDPGFGIDVTEKIKGLSSSTRFEFRVLATNDDGSSSSNTVEATTKVVFYCKKRRSEKGLGVVYAEVNKKGRTPVLPVTDEYAVVDYKKKAAKKGANAVPSDSGDVYAEVCSQQNLLNPQNPRTRRSIPPL